MVALQPIFKKAYWTLAAGGLVYVLFITSLTFPEVQRFFLYAHKVNPAYWQDVNQVEQFGFLKTQVQPFHLVTPDNETLYGWHLMPLHLCHEHEEGLMEHPPSGPAEDYTQTNAFKLLAENPNARVVVSFHGNAAHLGSAQRPANYNVLLGLSTPSHPIHVFALDYRGFGVSTGTPTEEGLITDGVSLLNFLTAGPLSIPPSRIVIMGQSLGTAVTAAVVERFAFGSPDPAAVQPALKDPEPFAGVILLASFSNLASLIKSYSVKGLTPPMLSPLVGYPRFQKWVMSHIVDSWDTAERVARLAGVNSTTSHDLHGSGRIHKDLDLTIIHAKNDIEIPWREGRRVWTAATGEHSEKRDGSVVYSIEAASGSQIEVWESKVPARDGSEATKKVRWERVQYGGKSAFLKESFWLIRQNKKFDEGRYAKDSSIEH